MTEIASGVTVRAYSPADRTACLALFDGNMPRFFAAEERTDFARFLEQDAERWAFRVLERDGRIVACGGLALARDGRSAHLCWGMVDQRLHGQGLGRLLTEMRLTDAAERPGIDRVHLDTSQHSHGFYGRLGFTVERVTVDGYGPGLDRYDMVCAF